MSLNEFSLIKRYFADLGDTRFTTKLSQGDDNIVQNFAASGKFDAIIGLGAVIRGSTPHFEFVAGENARALSSLALQYSIPVINAVLTTDTIEQAIERAGTKAGNKGADAAMAAMEMISLIRKIG